MRTFWLRLREHWFTDAEREYFDQQFECLDDRIMELEAVLGQVLHLQELDMQRTRKEADAVATEHRRTEDVFGHTQ